MVWDFYAYLSWLVLPLLTDTPCCVIFHSQILLCVKVVLDELLGPGRWMEGGSWSLGAITKTTLDGTVLIDGLVR